MTSSETCGRQPSYEGCRFCSTHDDGRRFLATAPTIPRESLILGSGYRLVALGLLLPVIGLAQAPPTDSNTEQKLQASEWYFRAHKDREAESLLEQVLKRSPDSFGANELMGLVLASEGQEDAANAFFEKAVRIQPKLAEAHQNLATNLLRLKRFVLAEQEFKQAALLSPGGYITNHDLGEFYLSRGRLPDAVAYLKKAQEARPESYSNGCDLVLAEIQSDKLQEAEIEINALMRVRDTGDLHALLAAVKDKQQDYLAAGKEYQRAAQMEPSENNIFAWGAELLRHRTSEPAIQVLTRGVELYPKSARLQIGLGIAFFMREYYEPAVDAFCHAVDLDPKDPRPYDFLARLYAIAPSRASEVRQRFAQLVQLQPRNARARYYYGVSLWKSARSETRVTDLPKVESLFRTAINLDPTFAEAYLQLGVLCSEEKKDSEALRDYEKAVELNPRLADAHYRLGQALLRWGNTARGERELKISSELHTHQSNEREELNSEILRFVYTEPGASRGSLAPH